MRSRFWDTDSQRYPIIIQLNGFFSGLYNSSIKQIINVNVHKTDQDQFLGQRKLGQRTAELLNGMFKQIQSFREWKDPKEESPVSKNSVHIPMNGVTSVNKQTR